MAAWEAVGKGTGKLGREQGGGKIPKASKLSQVWLFLLNVLIEPTSGSRVWDMRHFRLPPPPRLRRPLLEESKHLTKKESTPLIGGPQGCLQRQMGGDLTKLPRTVLGAHLTDKTSLPGNRAFPLRGLIRGLVRLCVWKI